MPTEQKAERIRELTDQMSRMQAAVVADYRGLTVAELTQLRRALREKGAEFIIAKNTLACIAARATGNEALEAVLEGPTGIAFAYEDIAGMAKVLRNFIKDSKKDIVVRGGVVAKQAIGPDDLERLANLPTREESFAKILGGVQAPASRILGAVNGVMRNIAYILKAYSEKDAAA